MGRSAAGYARGGSLGMYKTVSIELVKARTQVDELEERKKK